MKRTNASGLRYLANGSQLMGIAAVAYLVFGGYCISGFAQTPQDNKQVLNAVDAEHDGRTKESSAQGDDASKVKSRSPSTQLIDNIGDTPPGKAPVGARWALLIGINGYEHKRPLHYCCADMEQLYDVLVTKGGYDKDHVKLLCDSVSDIKKTRINSPPSFENIFSALEDFLKQAQPEDTVLFAFAGHGCRDDKKRSYLLPIGGRETNVARTGLSLEELNDMLAKCPAKRKLVVIDACHSGGETRGGSGDSEIQFTPPNLTEGVGCVYFYSCGGSELSWEDEKLGHGVFSYFFAQGLRGNADLPGFGNQDGRVDVQEAYRFVHQRVTEYTQRKTPKQTPVLEGKLQGDLVLAEKAVVSTSPAETRKSLAELVKEGKIAEDLLQIAGDVEQAEPAFGPAKAVSMLLDFLAKGTIDERQFRVLGKTHLTQLKSHVAAVKTFRDRRLRALCIGITYQGTEGELESPVNDAVRFHELLRKNAGDCKAVLLTESAATPEAIEDSLNYLSKDLRAGDIFMVTYSGYSNYSTKAINKRASKSEIRSPDLSRSLRNEQLWVLPSKTSSLIFESDNLSDNLAELTFKDPRSIDRDARKPEADELARQREERQKTILNNWVNGFERFEFYAPLRIMKILQSCPAHVVLINDTDANAEVDWGTADIVSNPGAARVVMAIQQVLDLRYGEGGKFGSNLAISAYRALDGLADGANPRTFTIDLNQIENNDSKKLALSTANYAVRSDSVGTDGFVTISEFAEFLTTVVAFEKFNAHKPKVYWQSRGDAVLTRSSFTDD